MKLQEYNVKYHNTSQYNSVTLYIKLDYQITLSSWLFPPGRLSFLWSFF